MAEWPLLSEKWGPLRVNPRKPLPRTPGPHYRDPVSGIPKAFPRNRVVSNISQTSTNRQRGSYFSYYRNERRLLSELSKLTLDPFQFSRRHRAVYRSIYYGILPYLRSRLFLPQDSALLKEITLAMETQMNTSEFLRKLEGSLNPLAFMNIRETWWLSLPPLPSSSEPNRVFGSLWLSCGKSLVRRLASIEARTPRAAYLLPS